MTVIDAVSPKFAKCVNFIDVVFCTWIHNPILASTVMLLSALQLLGLQMMSAPSSEHFVNVSFSDYFLDFLHNAVNLLFIIRFPATSKKGLSIVSSTLGESVLLLIQNAGCAALFLCPQYSLLYSNMHPVLKGIMLWQIVFPYLIFLVHICESKWNKLNGSEKLLQLEDKMLTSSLLVDTNNNLLPVFMAHSFAAVNFNFPLVSSFWALLIYKLACFSLKFYLINRYVLYELVMVINDVSNLNSCAELYMPVMIGERQKSWYDHIARHTTVILIVCCSILMGLDAEFMAVSFMK